MHQRELGGILFLYNTIGALEFGRFANMGQDRETLLYISKARSTMFMDGMVLWLLRRYYWDLDDTDIETVLGS